MSRTFLCTTGTSIAQGCKALADYQKRASTWDEAAPELTAQIRERLQAMDLAAEAGRVRASAELNALQRLPVHADDEVVLLATDTANGRACAEAVREALSTHFGVSRVIIERIEGLQVRDAELLRRVGLANLTRRLVHYLDDPQRRYGGGCVLCPNGGFKGIVPFLTILGMIYRAPVVYVFEFAETLIKLPPLPIGFATDLFDRAMPALRWAADEGIFDPETFYRKIPGFASEERDWFGSFLEVAPEDGGQSLASLSPLAEVLVQREGGPEPALMLSAPARGDLDGLLGRDLKEVRDHLRKLSSPLWRSQHRDTKYTNDLDFYPRGHNPWRFAGFVEGGVFHLCWFAKHDDYERRMALPAMQRAAFPRADFSRYVIPEVEMLAVAADHPDALKDWQEIRGERDAALVLLTGKRQANLELKAKLSRFEAMLDKLREENEILKKAAASKAGAPKCGSRFIKPPDSLPGTALNARVVGVKCDSYTLHADQGDFKIRMSLERVDALELPIGEIVGVRITAVIGKQALCVLEGSGQPLPEFPAWPRVPCRDGVRTGSKVL